METLAQHPSVTAAKAEFDRAINRMKTCLECTPDDKLAWAPAPGGRTPLMQVAHVAAANEGMAEWFQGKEMDWSDIKAIDAGWRESERKVTTREEAVARLEKSAATYHAYLDSLTHEQVESTLKSPMGEFPMKDAITFPADHVRGHCAQMDYIQTCYGDLDWHMG